MPYDYVGVAPKRPLTPFFISRTMRVSRSLAIPERVVLGLSSSADSTLCGVLERGVMRSVRRAGRGAVVVRWTNSDARGKTKGKTMAMAGESALC